jgi:DNA oxidative demethylase
MRYKNLNLFENVLDPESHSELTPGVALLRGFALTDEATLLLALSSVVAEAPFRHMTTKGGFRMSVAMTSCGSLGWTSNERGYSYASEDPVSLKRWPAMPSCFLRLAQQAAAACGFPDFIPDSCLINRYEPGARLSMHQDRNEQSFEHPIVSVSLGLPATFMLGGLERTDKAARIALLHGDVMVWGGVARLLHHGVLAPKAGNHPLLGSQRVNLTFRKAG